MIVRENVPLAALTTFEVGGAARFLIEATSSEDVRAALLFARERELAVRVLGSGSNVLVADSGFGGLVLLMRAQSIAVEEHADRSLVTVSAGVLLDDLVAASGKRGLVGLESLSGIPGTVGGAVVANAGAYGASCGDMLVSVDVINRVEPDLPVQTIMKEACDFAYHDSLFSKEPEQFIVIAATFALSRGDATMLTLRRAEILDTREKKGALIQEGRESYKCAGSFFHMPYVSADEYEQIVARARALDAVKEERLRPWAWPQTDGRVKLAPGFLLEYTPFQKGYVRGAVGISPRHTLSIINVGDARASDIAQLARDMQTAVKNIFTVSLEREVEYIGEVE